MTHVNIERLLAYGMFFFLSENSICTCINGCFLTEDSAIKPISKNLTSMKCQACFQRGSNENI